MAWISTALALGYFGNGEHHALHVLQNDPNVYTPALVVASAAATTNVLIFLYVNIWIRRFCGVLEDPELYVPWAIPIASLSCVTCGISMVVACWGVWSWATPVIGGVHLMAVIMLTNFIPTFLVKDHKE